MKFKYIGDKDEVTVRGVTFKKGKLVTIDDMSLAMKICVLDDFEEVKRKAKSND